MQTESPITKAAFAAVAETDRTGRLSACQRAAEPGNFFRHVASLALTKTADGLIDPKLVLSWLLTTRGAPAFWIGLLVPVPAAVIVFDLVLMTGLADGYLLVIGAVALASALWLVASVIFATVDEETRDTARPGCILRSAKDQIALLRTAPDDKRTEYTAVSNTVIGVALLGSGVFGAFATTFGAVRAVALFAGMSSAGVATALGLDEVQRD